MTSKDLIQSGLCDDLGEVLDAFPMEFLDDFGLGGSMSLADRDAGPKRDIVSQFWRRPTRCP